MGIYPGCWLLVARCSLNDDYAVCRCQQPATSTRRQKAPTPSGLFVFSLLLNDPNPYFGLDVGVQADRHAVDAERLDRLVKIDLSLLDVKALSFELLRDVGRRH